MDWRWILFQAACAMLIWYFAAARSRSSMQTHANELRRAAQEMSLQSQQLTSARKAAKESKHESQRRAQELKTLHDRVATLTKENNALTRERDAMQTKVQTLQTDMAELESKLEKAEQKSDKLQKEVTAASIVRLELQSRLRTDERLAALSRLRKPLPPVSPQMGVVSPIAKSPSESMLWGLHPDLEISDEEGDEIREGKKNFRELGERMERLRKEMEVPVVKLGAAAVEGRWRLTGDEGEEQPRLTSETGTEGSASVARMQIENTSEKVDVVLENVASATAKLEDELYVKGEALHVITGEALSTATQLPDHGGLPNAGKNDVEEINTAVSQGLPAQSFDYSANGPDHVRSSEAEEVEVQVVSVVQEGVVKNLSNTTENIASPTSTAAIVEEHFPTEYDTEQSPGVGAMDPEYVVPAKNTLRSDTVSSINVVGHSEESGGLSTIARGNVSSESQQQNSLDISEDLGYKADKQALDAIHDDIGRKRRTKREGSTLSSSQDSLSVDRTPWLDTLSPGLHRNNSGLSIAGVLQSPRTRGLAQGIISSSEKLDS